MSDGSLSEFEYVLNMLASSMEPLEKRGQKRDHHAGIVLLLGAGCSRQYGLPNFNELLSYIWDDCFSRPADSLGGFQALRDELEKYWQAQGPESRSRILGRHLNRSTTVCPGYTRLAKLCMQRYVKAIINMNFDTLLEQALANELKGQKGGGLQFKVSTSFRASSDDHLIVYKPHGTLEPTDTEAALRSLIQATENLLGVAEVHSDYSRDLYNQILACQKRIQDDHFWVAEDILQAIDELVKAARKLANHPVDGAKAGMLFSAVERAKAMRRHPLWAKNDLILDIANSDLFADPDEQKKAHELLTRYDVVSIGYSGVDAKIAAALRGFEGRDPRDRKLYFVNLTRPDPRMLLVMAERASQDLCIAGEDAIFENFVEHLERVLDNYRSENKAAEAETRRASKRHPHFMTRDERNALDESLRLALSIRAAINVGDRSSTGIQEHGDHLYEICADLAWISGICLTSPEKFMLHSAAYLHDLGYFSASSWGSSLPGVELLKNHGEVTAKLLLQRYRDDEQIFDKITPASYQGDGRALFQSILVDMCRYHASFGFPSGERTPEVSIQVQGIEVPLRCELVHALLSAAEHIVLEHPFLASSDPVVAKEESSWAIEDPVLDLCLLRSDPEIEFPRKRKWIEGRITTQFQGRETSLKARWLLSRAACFIKRLVEDHTKGVEFVCTEVLAPVEGKDENAYLFKPLLEQALGEQLDGALQRIQRSAQAELADILDRAGGILEKLQDRVQGLIREQDKARDPLKGDTTLDDLIVILPLIRVWLGTIPRQLREGWLSGMELDLDFAERVVNNIWLRHGKGADEDLEAARKALERSVKEFKRNAPGASIHAAVGTLVAAQKIVEWVCKVQQLPEEIGLGLSSVRTLLAQFRKSVDECSAGEAIATADLLAIYTLPQDGPEPRVKLSSEPVSRAIQRLDRMRRLSPPEPLHTYIRRKRAILKGVAPSDEPMTKAFLSSFEEIIHPAWRFFARHWHDRSETLLMARACLDLGSSRFRPEVAGGLKNMLERADWSTRELDGETVEVAYGHDECTLCTARLLYVFSYAKRLFPQEELARFKGNKSGKSFDETVSGLLHYFLWRPSAHESWWGLGKETDAGRGIHSADYISWAARAVAFARSVDREIEERTGDSWLKNSCGIDVKKLNDLIRQRWDALFALNTKGLLSPQTEEPQSFTLGRVALAFLDLQRMDDTVREFILKSRVVEVESFHAQMKSVFKEVWRDNLAQMSQFYLLPMRLLLDSSLKDAEDQEEKRDNMARMIGACQTCIESRIWIREGPDAGSWGFNVKNTQAIVTALVAFWRYAYDPANVDRFQEAFRESSSGPSAGPSPVSPHPASSRGRRPAKSRSMLT